MQLWHHFTATHSHSVFHQFFLSLLSISIKQNLCCLRFVGRCRILLLWYLVISEWQYDDKLSVQSRGSCSSFIIMKNTTPYTKEKLKRNAFFMNYFVWQEINFKISALLNISLNVLAKLTSIYKKWKCMDVDMHVCVAL